MSKAEELSYILDDLNSHLSMAWNLETAAKELRRLDAVNKDLLEALQSCAVYLTGNQTRNIVSDEIQADKARAAISKATGEKQ